MKTEDFWTQVDSNEKVITNFIRFTHYRDIVWLKMCSWDMEVEGLNNSNLLQ